MNYINEISSKDINMNPFKIKKELNKDFFKDGKTMDSRIRMQLLDIADDFIETLKVKWVKPLDIVVTGSIVNYNWSEYSDVDVHVIYDFRKIYKKPEFVKDYFMAKRDVWNSHHDSLAIKGFPVEISVEDVNSPLQSSGVYSIEKNEWVKEPKEMDGSNIDVKGIQKYCARQITKMDELFAKMDKETDRKKLENLANELESILDAVHDKRTDGLKTKEKELSNGNIMWKVVKHMGYADKVYDYLNKVYDRRNTIKESHTIIISEAQRRAIKNKKQYGPLSKFIPTINKTLSLKDEFALNPYSQNDKRLAYAAFAKAGFKNIGTLKDNEEGWIMKMTLGNANRMIIRGYIMRVKAQQFAELMKELEEEKWDKMQDSLVNMPAADMQNFIDTDDVSQINENRQYLTIEIIDESE